ncbi:F-box/FBD/LRR-repeat protein [Actinidia chinensis var. chinensis]|uniref:F-box/FBD/LRR-repeat protein n=1 Tax=Actinidia chinensis var. chinensis TaxID=1590841 RepID=A0A2R6PFD9_ACTCC|nr:F-box/FBD/LRR-repeat protein [Actinidia chinensis var. chinensis]
MLAALVFFFRLLWSIWLSWRLELMFFCTWHVNPHPRKMGLQLLISRLFASFGHGGRNAECQRESAENFMKGNTDSLLDEDRISSLPDEILSIIITFLNMRDAVKTSMLSRRWKHLYALLSDVNFDMEMFGWNGNSEDSHKTEILERGCIKNKHTLAKAVNQFLKIYLGPKLHSFRVSFCFDSEYTSCADLWISLAVKAGIEKLDLTFVCKDYLYSNSMYENHNFVKYTLSWRHLSGAFNLKHLRLHSCRLLIDSSCEISGLTVLDLNYVPLQSNQLSEIFCSCLNLEWLKLRGCRLSDKLCVSGLARLKFLAVDNCPGLKEVRINAINLATFEFCDRAVKKLSFSCVPNLEKVFFCLHVVGALPYIYDTVASNLPRLKSLWISTSTFWVKEITASPYMVYIKQLELFINIDDGFDMVKIIAPLLRACPLLQRLNVVVYKDTIEGSMNSGLVEEVDE